MWYLMSCGASGAVRQGALLQVTCGVTHLNVCEAQDTQDVCCMQLRIVRYGAETCESSNVRETSCA